VSASAWTIVKLRPNGAEATRYSGARIEAPAGWIAVRAAWVHGRMDLGYLVFEPDDWLDEYFALERPYNAFALYRASGAFVGWYCNVTHPTAVTGRTITWHDLYVDVIVYPDGRALVLDEDELAESGVAQQDPALHACILNARDELLQLAAARAYPFSEAPENVGAQGGGGVG
jgi:hypothetical protein